ncbi:hypothetical protein MXB_4829, partial [Myxobolus squamalis]
MLNDKLIQEESLSNINTSNELKIQQFGHGNYFERIRTYFMTTQTIKDHRFGYECKTGDKILFEPKQMDDFQNQYLEKRLLSH